MIRISNEDFIIIIKNMYKLIENGKVKKGKDVQFNELFKNVHKVIAYLFTSNKFSGLSIQDKEDLTLETSIKIFKSIMNKQIKEDSNIHSYITTACYNCFNTLYKKKMLNTSVSLNEMIEENKGGFEISTLDYNIPHQN